jgi:hypothetical protein
MSLIPNFLAKLVAQVIEIFIGHAAVGDLLPERPEKLLDTGRRQGVLKEPCRVNAHIFAADTGSLAERRFSFWGKKDLQHKTIISCDSANCIACIGAALIPAPLHSLHVNLAAQQRAQQLLDTTHGDLALVCSYAARNRTSDTRR